MRDWVERVVEDGVALEAVRGRTDKLRAVEHRDLH